MTVSEINEALKHTLEVNWQGEPLLGGQYGDEEINAVVEAIKDSMAIDRGFGFSAEPIVKFEEEFAAYTGTKYACAVNSAGPGQDIVFRYLNLQPGDEVIVPCINYDAAPLAVLGAGGKVVWGEVREEDMMLDPADVERKITPRTRAIFPVHIHGLCAPMDEYMEIAARHPHPVHGPAKVIGDAARATGGDYKGTKVGKIGWATIYSFQTMKNMTTLGEGGMIVTDDPDLNKYAHSVRMYGRDLAMWGTSNVMTKPQAAVGRVQLKKLDSFIAGRRQVAAKRSAMLEGVELISLPARPHEHSFYLYPLMLDESLAGPKRDLIVNMMMDRYKIGCFIANPPVFNVHKYVGMKCGWNSPVSVELSRRVLCLPVHPFMSDADNKFITAAFIKCLEEVKNM